MSPAFRKPRLTAASLVRKGYLARELPPPFTSETLADLFKTDPAALNLKGDRTEGARHNLARLSGFRRPLTLPNPRSYITLARVLENQWTDIDAHCKSQTLSISRPVVTRTAERAVRPRFRLGEGPKLRARLWRGQKYVLRLDVSQFYPTLYTHAVPWALHSKAVAKAKIGKTKGDKIDRALRDTASGQTIGIPIGPDTSFVVAEIVLTAVDAALKGKVSKLRGFRYLDDYEAAFRSRAEAEEAQFHLESALGDFELVINPFKTHILELPQPWRASWPHDLQTFPIRTASSKETLNDVIALFSRAAEIARAHPYAGALKYALQRSRDVAVDAAAWRTFQGLVWSSISMEPTTMATGLDLLAVKSDEAGRAINKAGAAEVIEALIVRNAPLRNGSEVAWAIWAAILLDVKLSAAAGAAVSGMEDDFVALLCLHADDRSLFRAALDKTTWETLIDYDDVLVGPHWLLAYEATYKGWLTSARARVKADPFFKTLQKRDVFFYDEDPDREPFTGPGGPLPGGPLPDSYL
jgi:hypothetical protein